MESGHVSLRMSGLFTSPDAGIAIYCLPHDTYEPLLLWSAGSSNLLISWIGAVHDSTPVERHLGAVLSSQGEPGFEKSPRSLMKKDGWQ